MKNIIAPRNLKIKGQDHMLAYITAKEAAALKARGGSGRMTKYGVRSYEDGDGPGGDSSDNSNSNSEASAQDAAGGNAGQGAGPTGAGAGSTGEPGPGPTGPDTGGETETSVTAPTPTTAPEPTPTTNPFGQFGTSLGFGVVGGLAGLGLGVPGLGTIGSSLGAAYDAARANEQLGMMGLEQNINTPQAIANAVSMGLMGTSVANQFGQSLGFDALAEAPMSAFSGPAPGPPGPGPDTSGGEFTGLLSQDELPSAVGPLQQRPRYQIVNNTLVPIPSGLLG